MTESSPLPSLGTYPLAREGFSRTGLTRIASFGIYCTLGIIAAKPLLDIPGKKVPYDTVDAGMVATVAGAFFMVVSYLAVLAFLRTVPVRLFLAQAGVLLLGLLSLVDLLIIDSRRTFLDLFASPPAGSSRAHVFGSYVPPVEGTLSTTFTLLASFAPVTLLAVVFLWRSWFATEKLRWTVLVFLFGTLVHCVIAVLQTAGVVAYTFFFQLPTGPIGRPSGAYFHPASLGRLLIFAVFAIYVFGNRLRLHILLRYGLIALFLGTAVITTHRATILCILIFVAAFEIRRIPAAFRAVKDGRVSGKVTIPAGAILILLAIVAAIRWGGSVWRHLTFLATNIGSLNISSGEFLSGRGEIWSAIATRWSHAGADIWLIGVGYEPWNTHSDFVRVPVVWGLLGTVAMGLVFFSLWRTTQRTVNAEGRWALAALYVMAAFFAFTQLPTSYPYFMWLFVLSHILLIVNCPREPKPHSGGEGQ